MNRERSSRYTAVAVVVIILIVVAFLALYPRHFEVTWEGEGSASVIEGDVNAIDGTTIEVHPADGWFVETVTVDSTPVTVEDGAISIGASLLDLSSISVHIVFSETPIEPVVTHTVTITNTDGGDVTPFGAVVVEDGGSLTIRFDPDPGYRTSTVTLDGEPVSANGSLTLDDIVEDHSVHVVFVRTQTPGGGGGGGTEPSTTLLRIEVTSDPYKTVYKVGDTFDATGMTVHAYYSDGSNRQLSEDEFSVSPTKPLGIEDTMVTVAHMGMTDTVEIMVGDDGGFSVTVTRLEGTMVENGSVKGFSETLDLSLKDFEFRTTPIVPGITQTATMTVTNDSNLDLEAFVYIDDLDFSDARELADQIVLTVTCGDKTEEATLSEISSGALLDLGTILDGGSAMVTASISFPHSDHNNEAMGQSLTFTLGVFADVPPEGA